MLAYWSGGLLVPTLPVDGHCTSESVVRAKKKGQARHAAPLACSPDTIDSLN
jgi:hypothetical protein